jgi:hypothetical protein
MTGMTMDRNTIRLLLVGAVLVGLFFLLVVFLLVWVYLRGIHWL